MLHKKHAVLAGVTLLIGIFVLLHFGQARPAAPQQASAQSTQQHRGLTTEQEAATLAFLRAEHPALPERLAEQKVSDPPGYDQVMVKIHRFMVQRQDKPQDIREAMDREKRTQLAVARLFSGLRQNDDPSNASALSEKLRQAVATHFDAEQRLRAARLAQLDSQIRQLRRELQNQQLKREQIIDQRVARWQQAAQPTTRSSE